MKYEELKVFCGTELTDKLRHHLTPDQFNKIDLESLPDFLEDLADVAHRNYEEILFKSYQASMIDRDKMAVTLQTLRRRWQEAEELAYRVVLADFALTKTMGFEATTQKSSVA